MMNEQKKEQVMSLINKTLVKEGMDAGHLFMIMTDKGYGAPAVQDFFNKAGVNLTNAEFLEVYNGMKQAIDDKAKQVEEKKIADSKEPTFQDILKNKNIVTNNQDLLSNIEKKEDNSFVTENYTKNSSGSYFTTGPTENEPAAEAVTLPSKGRFYNGILADKKGKILIRPMTLTEEKIFTTERLLRNGQAIDMVFRNCIKTPGIDTTELLSSDRMFLLFFLRAISYGPIYSIKTKCTSCGADNEDKLNIEELQIKEPHTALVDPFIIELPASKLKLTMRISRGRDESEMIKNSNLKKDDDSPIVDRILSLLIGIDGVTKENYRAKLEMLIGKDVSHIRKTLEIIDFGYNVDKVGTCTKCKSEYKLALTLNENFFRSE
jgi:hypothetical protein